jgi:hypothetical protein
MQQSLFGESAGSVPDHISVRRTVEAHWRIAIIVALGLAGTAFVAALLAIALVFLH